MAQRKIIHIDMDCFYAAVEAKYHPELKGLALGIGGTGPRSVLCTASYEARKYGVRAAMPTALARSLCPTLKILPPNFELYKKESTAIREIFRRYTPLVEPLSLDEAYLDVSDCSIHGGSATLIAQDIRKAIFDEIQLSASAGVAPNKFLAKIASDWNKPNGSFVIPPHLVSSFMPALPVEKLHGVGKVTTERLHKLGLKTCGDIQNLSNSLLKEYFGKRAEEWAKMALGNDERPVCTSWERKSLSVEETFREDRKTLESLVKELPAIYKDFDSRMQKSKVHDRIRGFIVKIKYFDFTASTHEVAHRSYPQISDFEKLLLKLWEKRAAPVRLLGIGTRLLCAEEPKNRPQLSFDFGAAN